MKACVSTLGCKMNEVESESLMRGLEERGYEVTDALGYADLYVLNTCAVTAEAVRKSRQAIARVRKFNPGARIVVCGCAAQHAPKSFLAREGVSLVTGAQKKSDVLSFLDQEGIFLSEDGRVFCEMPAPKRTKTRAFLRIQDGCDRFCTYCLIPFLRGRSRSRAAEEIVAEARACTAREIVLTGIDVSSYRDGETGLDGLLLRLAGLPARIRLGSLEVSAVTEGLLSAMRGAGNVVPHFHLSLQSGSSAVLRKMNRRYTREEYLAACARIYAVFPDAAITTDVIVGFPGETEEDFLQSLSMAEEAAFAQMHVFPFSAREGTAAAKMRTVPAGVKRERVARMLEAASRAEERYLARFTGREAEALFEEDGGYTANYIRVYAAGARDGSLCRVRLGTRERDGLTARIIEEIR